MPAADTAQTQPGRKKSKKQKKKHRQQQAQMAAAAGLDSDQDSDTEARQSQHSAAEDADGLVDDAVDDAAQSGQGSEDGMLERMMQAATVSQPAATSSIQVHIPCSLHACCCCLTQMTVHMIIYSTHSIETCCMLASPGQAPAQMLKVSATPCLARGSAKQNGNGPPETIFFNVWC